MAMVDRELMEEAEVLAFALASGLCCLSEVRDWVYAKIEALPQPPSALLDLTGCPDLQPTDAVHGLRVISGCLRDSAMLRRILRWLGGALRAHPDEASAIARILYRIAIDDRWIKPADHFLRVLYSFDDELELAERGIYGDPAAVVAAMQEFLDGL
jgi:hypothetical protein